VKPVKLVIYSVLCWACALCGGCYAAGGPVLAYATGRGVSVGWEAGGGVPVAHFNVGQAFRPRPHASTDANQGAATSDANPATTGTDDTDTTIASGTSEAGSTSASGTSVSAAKHPWETVDYVVFEPWYYVGATAGMAYEKSAGFSGVWGGWATVPANGISLAAAGFNYKSYGVDGSFLPFAIKNCSHGRSLGLGFSIAAGYRWLSGAHEIYVAPKLLTVHCGSLGLLD